MIILTLGEIHLIGGTGSVGEGLIKVGVPFVPVMFTSVILFRGTCIWTNSRCATMGGDVRRLKLPVGTKFNKLAHIPIDKGRFKENQHCH